MFVVRHSVPSVTAQFQSHLTWQPAADVYRCANGWLIKVELAGVRPEDVHIEADSRGITVSGSRRDFRQFEFQETYLMEISYSRFERVVPIPESVENAEFRAEYHDGMLYVWVFKTGQKEIR